MRNVLYATKASGYAKWQYYISPIREAPPLDVQTLASSTVVIPARHAPPPNRYVWVAAERVQRVLYHQS